MNTQRQTTLIFVCITILLGLVQWALIAPTTTPPTVFAANAEQGRPEQTVLSPEPEAGTAQLSSSGEGYLSPVTEADTPFTHVMVRAELTEGTRTMLTLELRVSKQGDGTDWSEWLLLEEDEELWLPEDGKQVFWSEIQYVGEDYRFWQVRVVAGADGTVPQVARMEVNTVDARFGAHDPRPTMAQDDIAQTSADTAGLARPAVVTRTGWGCPDGQSSRVTPAYRYATHMVIHHTAGNGSLRSGEETWADRVRAIWSFHTYTRGWGDIGYNFLIAPDGIIYEGRAGGDNAVGFHDTANYGSMGVSIIGTYDTINIPPSAQDSLVSLLAWRANTNDINPTGQAKYYGCSISSYCSKYTPNGILDTITGHRHVTPNYTSCPGQQTVSLLPSLRERVLQRMLEGGEQQEKPDNGDLVIDELEDSFTKSDAQWYRAACGDAGHTYYTYTTDTEAESTNNATWKPTAMLDGHYRVYAHIPQGCGLGDPPYASEQATYQVHSADGVAEVAIDHNTAEEWVELGTYQFTPDGEHFVTLSDLTNEPYSERRVLFFDSVKWVEETEPVEEIKVELLGVDFGKTTVAVGELLPVTFTVKNSGTAAIQTQNPQTELLPDGTFDANQGYVYEEDECILGDANLSYPVYPKEIDRFRVTLGATNRTVDCAGNVGDYPWRWGLNGELGVGETRTITGYVQFEQPGEVTLQAGLIEEYVKYHAQGVGETTITITEERQLPVASMGDKTLAPLAHVYQLADVPTNLLWRTLEAHSAQRGEYVGSFAWDGNVQDWGEEGPFGVQNNVLIEQTRVISLPVTGVYTFRVTSNGNAWLWVDGQQAVFNNGLGSPPDMIHEAYGVMTLTAGQHALSFRFFQLADVAKVGYAMQLPGMETFVQPTGDMTNVQPTTGTNTMLTFAVTPTFTLAAADFGGSDIASMRYSWDGKTWIAPLTDTIHTTPALLSVTPSGAGTHNLYYQAIDKVGNLSEVNTLTFQVAPPSPEPTPEPTPTPEPSPQPVDPGDNGSMQVFLPMVQRS